MTVKRRSWKKRGLVKKRKKQQIYQDWQDFPKSIHMHFDTTLHPNMGDNWRKLLYSYSNCVNQSIAKKFKKTDDFNSLIRYDVNLWNWLIIVDLFVTQLHFHGIELYNSVQNYISDFCYKNSWKLCISTIIICCTVTTDNVCQVISSSHLSRHSTCISVNIK